MHERLPSTPPFQEKLSADPSDANYLLILTMQKELK
jgi:hypothetical protein